MTDLELASMKASAQETIVLHSDKRGNYEGRCDVCFVRMPCDILCWAEDVLTLVAELEGKRLRARRSGDAFLLPGGCLVHPFKAVAKAIALSWGYEPLDNPFWYGKACAQTVIAIDALREGAEERIIAMEQKSHLIDETPQLSDYVDAVLGEK